MIVEIVFCYAREDEAMCKQLEMQLNPLIRQGKISVWHDRSIELGKDWEKEIDDHLNKAHIILLLISRHFVYSDYCIAEKNKAMARHNRGEMVRIIPIILSPIDWGWMFPDVVKLQALPKDAEAITRWPEQIDAFFDAAKSIRRVVEAINDPKGSGNPLPGNPLPEKIDKFLNSMYLNTISPIAQYIRKRRDKIALILPLLMILPLTLILITPINLSSPKPINPIGVTEIPIKDKNGNDIKIGIKASTDNFGELSGEQCVDQNNQNSTNTSDAIAIAVTTLSMTNNDPNISSTIGNEELQGICLWQNNFQKLHPGKTLHVLIANIGTKDDNVLAESVNLVTRQIIIFASHNSNFIGVVGFSFSQAVKDAMQELNENHIPVISPAASSSDFSGTWPYFSRVVTDSNTEGKHLAEYAKTTLNATYAYVFSDPNNPYSNTLGEGFSSGFNKTNTTTVPYTVNELNPGKVANALSDYSTHPGATIFCACYANDFSTLLTMRKGALTHAFFLGGEAAYEVGGYGTNSSKDSTYSNIDFAAYSFPDTPNVLCNEYCPAAVKSFAADYCKQFDPSAYASDPQSLKNCRVYEISRPGPHVMQTYDAIDALQQAYTNAPKKGGKVSREDIQQALTKLSFQGISGWINFGDKSSSDLQDKTVLILCVDGDGKAHLAASYGQFLQQDKPTPQYYPRMGTDQKNKHWQCQLPF